MREIRVGIIGTGIISRRHMKIYSHIPGFKVVAACDIDKDKLEKWGKEYQITQLYTDYRKMLERDDIDSVDVCVHNNLHLPMAIAVMKAGKDCYCEKPMAASYADCVTMMDYAKKLNRKLHVQISSLFTRQTRMGKEMIEKGCLGEVYHARSASAAFRRRPGIEMTDLSKDFYSRKYAGHGPMCDLGIYHLSQMLFMMGMPQLESVYGIAHSRIGCPESLLKGTTYEVEEMAVGMAKFKNHVSLEMTEAWATNMEDVGKSFITGTKGALQFWNVDTVGGVWGFGGSYRGMPPFCQPQMHFIGAEDGTRTDTNLMPFENEQSELLLHPEMAAFNDNQLHWYQYLTGQLSEKERYNTPEIAAQAALIAEGLFLSDELGRSVSAEEIAAMSKSTSLWKQETPWGTFEYDKICE